MGTNLKLKSQASSLILGEGQAGPPSVSWALGRILPAFPAWPAGGRSLTRMTTKAAELMGLDFSLWPWNVLQVGKGA